MLRGAVSSNDRTRPLRPGNRKVLTTHADPSQGVIAGVLELIRAENVDPGLVTRVIHATMLFTNALIERRGVPTALLTTEGFGDVLEIARERKYEIYDVFIEMPAPLVPRARVKEVRERIGQKGQEEAPLDIDGLLKAVQELVEDGVESVAIMFLHSYINPARQTARAALPRSAGTTTCRCRRYGAAVHDAVERWTDPHRRSQARPGSTARVRTRRRGACGRFLRAEFGAQSSAGLRHGGTTAKLSVVDDGEPLVAYRFEAAREKRFAEVSGLPVMISVIELIEIGAGGGSIAAIDATG